MALRGAWEIMGDPGSSLEIMGGGAGELGWPSGPESREIMGDHGRSWEIMGDHGRSREITGDHRRPWDMCTWPDSSQKVRWQSCCKRNSLGPTMPAVTSYW